MLAFKCKFYNRLSYQWVCLELGKHQIYELDVKFDHSVITIKIIPNPNLSSDAKEQGFADSNELVRSVQRFIDDLMKEHMTVTLAKAPVVCYIPCSQCKKMHLDVEKASISNAIYCPVNRVHADITDYHKILSGLYHIIISHSYSSFCHCFLQLILKMYQQKAKLIVTA